MMRAESHVNVHQRTLRAAERNGGPMPEVQIPKQTLIERFLPYGRLMRMTQEAKGVFIPYPLLGIIITLCVLLVTGIVAIQVQVSNLSTTILLRDADQRAAIQQLQEKTEQLQVYIYDSREKLIRLQTQSEQDSKRR